MFQEANLDEAVATLKERDPERWAGLTPDQLSVIPVRFKKGCVAKGEQVGAQIILELLDERVYRAMLIKGAEALANLGPLNKVEKGDVEAAMEAGLQQIEAMYSGELRLPPGLGSLKKTKEKKTSDRAIEAEARRISKQVVKDHIRSNNEKIGDYDPKDITKAANGLLEDEEYAFIWTEAEAAVKARHKEAEETLAKVEKVKNKAALIHLKANPQRKAEREAKGKPSAKRGRPASHVSA